MHIMTNTPLPLTLKAGDKIVGEFPIREMRLVQGWIELQRDELNREWQTLKEGGAWFTIAGLRR